MWTRVPSKIRAPVRSGSDGRDQPLTRRQRCRWMTAMSLGPSGAARPVVEGGAFTPRPLTNTFGIVPTAFLAVASSLLPLASATAENDQLGSTVQFVDVTIESGISFVHENAASSEKFLIETMGGGAGWTTTVTAGLISMLRTVRARMRSRPRFRCEALFTVTWATVNSRMSQPQPRPARRDCSLWVWPSVTTTTTATPT